MTDILEQRLKPSADVVASRVGEDTVMLHLGNGIYFGMDEIGTLIWEGIGGGERPRDICSRLSREYEIPLERVEEDARTFLNDLIENSIVSIDEP